MSKLLFVFVYTSVYPRILKIPQVIDFLGGKVKEMVIPVRLPGTYSVLLSKPSDISYADNADHSLIFSPACAHFCVHRRENALYAFAHSLSNSIKNNITDRWPFWPFQHVQGGVLG